jgi:hypothetical protein
VQPAANAFGEATITVSVSDGALTTSDHFLLTVNSVNDAPTLTGIADQMIPEDGVSGPLSFTVSDVETPANRLAVTADSSNPALFPVENIVLGGEGADRTVTLIPAAGGLGEATISIRVTDGDLTSSGSFLVSVRTGPRLSIVGEDELSRVILRIDGWPGKEHIVEASAALDSWTFLGSVRVETGTAFFTDPQPATRTQRCYRLRVLR